MIFLDRITVRHDSRERYIEFYCGDLANLPESHAVDVLVVSAFRDDYLETSRSLMGSLGRAGIHVGELAQDKAYDLRDSCSCWISKEVRHPRARFRRLLCFEPRELLTLAQVVGDIFRSMVPFASSVSPLDCLALPLVGSGNMGFPEDQVLTALVESAANWLEKGLPIKCIKIVEINQAKAERLRPLFATLRNKLTPAVAPPAPSSAANYDFFISYAHKDGEDVARMLVHELE